MTDIERSEIVQPNPDALVTDNSEALRILTENMDALWQELGGEPGYYPFFVGAGDVEMLRLSVRDHGNRYIELMTRPVQVGVSNRSKPYYLYTENYVQIDGTVVRYGATDYVEYEWRHNDDGTLYSAELDSAQAEYDDPDKLPPHILALITTANEIMPSLTLDQLVEDQVSKYIVDPVKKEEERQVESAISTAVGALSLIQYVLLEKVANSESAGIVPRELVFELGHSRVTALEDPDIGERRDHWQPDIVRLQEPGSFSPVRMVAAEYDEGVDQTAKHMVTKSFFEHGGVISLEVDDTIWVGKKPIELVGSSVRLNPDDILPEQVKKVVRSMLHVINQGISPTL